MSFCLKLQGGKEHVVEAESLSDACSKAGLPDLTLLDSYEVDGRVVQVASQSNCGCVYHAEQGLACPHDLQRAGLS